MTEGTPAVTLRYVTAGTAVLSGRHRLCLSFLICTTRSGRSLKSLPVCTLKGAVGPNKKGLHSRGRDGECYGDKHDTTLGDLRSRSHSARSQTFLSYLNRGHGSLSLHLLVPKQKLSSSLNHLYFCQCRFSLGLGTAVRCMLD